MTKKQHYLPQFYLKNFVGDKGKIWTYDRSKEKIYACNPRDIACENYLYETRWENANSELGEFVLPNHIEKQFAEQEGKYSKLLKRIVEICTNAENEKALICNREEKEILASFVSNMVLRNPWSMEKADLECVTDGVMDLKEIKAMDTILQYLGYGGTESLVKFSSKRIWLDNDFEGGMQQVLQEELRGTNFCILKANNKQFITSSFPVSFGNGTYFPLSPQFALLYYDEIPYQVKNRMALMPEDEMDFCNNQYIKLSIEQVRFIFAKEKKVLEQLAEKEC